MTIIRKGNNRYFKVLLTILFAFFFINAENNLCSRSTIDKEIFTLAEDNRLSELFYNENIHKLDSLISICNKRYGFNGNVLVGQENKIIYHKSFGFANLRKTGKLSTESVFQLASVSKQFTAMAVMMLQERGELDWDDSIKMYIPDFPYEDVTVRHLLNHTSGLPNYMWLIEHHWENDSVIPDNGDMVKMLNDHKLASYFSSGRRYEYSNTGYAVLAYLVEVITGETFGDFLHANIFEPLQMYHSFVYNCASDTISPQKLDGYYRRWGRYRLNTGSIHDGIVGDKGIFSTTGDLYKWDQALYSYQLVSYATLELAFQSGILKNKKEIPYGYGFRLRNNADSRIIYHHGKWCGFRTAFERYIDKKTTIIILDHTNFRNVGQMAKNIYSIFSSTSEIVATEWLVRSSFELGVNASLNKFEIIFKDWNKIDQNVLLDVIDWLEKIDKPQKSRIVKELFYEVSRESTLALDKTQ